MRKPPTATLKDVPATVPTRADVVVHERKYELITPLFGGGVKAGETDPITVINGKSVRGQLRFWWRATRGGQFGKLPDPITKLREAEVAIWGAASIEEKNLASKVEVTLQDNRTYIAKVIGEDKNTDLALLKVEVENTNFLVFGNSDSLRIGEWVLAVGNPFRLQSSVTAGIVSAKARSINLLENQGIESFIQTDAAFNPGSSGGALVNTSGELVGIATAILSESGRYEGFSFAVPGNLARKVVADLKEFGTVQRGWLGVDIENIDNKMAEELGLNEVSGVLISHASKDGGAAESGIQNNDVIVSINNVKINNTSEFMELLGQYRPGEKLEVIYIRNKVKKMASPVLRNQLNTTDLIGVVSSGTFNELGFEVRELDSYEKAIYSPTGVKVISIQNGSIVAHTRMEPDYIITKINNKKITSIRQVKKMLEESKGKSIILEGFYPKYPGEYPYTFVVP